MTKPAHSRKIFGSRKRLHFWGVLFPVVGMLALIWYLVRVVTKPSRANYPCQRIAGPLAWSFSVWILGWVATLAIFRKAKKFLRQCRPLLAFTCLLVALAVALGNLNLSANDASGESAAFVPSDPPNKPIGIARGINPGRVVWAHNPEATSWDGVNGNWWDDNNIDQSEVDVMLSQALQALTDKKEAAAWDALFRYHNQSKGKGDVGYKKGEKVVVKINMNNHNRKDSEEKKNQKIDASPQMVRALLRQLVNQAGVEQSSITVYDGVRRIGEPIYSRCHPEFPEVNFVSKYSSPGRGQVVWVPEAVTYSAEITDSRVRSLPRCALEAEYMINMPILKRHDYHSAVSLSAKNHMGSVDHPGALHGYSHSWIRGMGTYDPLVDLMGHKHLGGKTLLYIIDGLYGGDSAGAVPKKWKSAPFNDDWPSSVLVSSDGVAIDSVGLDFLRAEWELKPNGDNYLHEAALADKPPSGIFYDPEKDDSRMKSLGVHEHWNNPKDKQYSRNLGKKEGIELVAVKKTKTE